MICIDKKELPDLLNRLCNISSAYPNFILSGHSVLELEDLAEELKNDIESNNLLSFSGVVKHFSLRVPCVTDPEGEHRFLSRFYECLSIAADCYSVFCGVVTLELTPEWRHRLLEAVPILLRILRDCPQVCFLLILPEQLAVEQLASFKTMIGRGASWIDVTCSDSFAEQCSDRFLAFAGQKGFFVPLESGEYLRDVLCKGFDSNLDPVLMAENMVNQIELSRQLSFHADRTITVEDLQQFDHKTAANMKIRIGFQADSSR